MRNFVVHSNESACRKSVCLGMEQVIKGGTFYFQGNAGTVTELGDYKGDQCMYFLILLFWKKKTISI